jgi:HAE1 family hydrophobic/amphiphilic exporter-1
LLDKAGSGIIKNGNGHDFVKELNKTSRISFVLVYSASFPQFMLKVDNDLAQQKGVSIENAMSTLSPAGSTTKSVLPYGFNYKVIVCKPRQNTAPLPGRYS